MRIGVLGTGNMAEALATHWIRARHDLAVGGRDADRTQRLVARLGGGAKAAGLREAAAFGDAVLAALPFDAGAGVVRELRAPLEGKALIDCSNPVGPGFRLLTRDGRSAAERLADAAPGVNVVKAFNLCHEDVWRMAPPVFDGRAAGRTGVRRRRTVPRARTPTRTGHRVRTRAGRRPGARGTPGGHGGAVHRAVGRRGRGRPGDRTPAGVRGRPRTGLTESRPAENPPSPAACS